MNRRKFIAIAVGTIATGAATVYLLSDKSNLVREDLKPADGKNEMLKPDEKEILYLASLAPSGHNTQPWFVQYLEPYHWIIGNDKTKWLPAVDPTQRGTLLSIGAFLQNLEKDEAVATLLDTGRRMQRLFLKVRERNIAVHPMTQIVEEASTRETLYQPIGIFAQERSYEVNGEYKQFPWAGCFGNYQEKSGMMIPLDCEVEWQLPEGKAPYFKRRIAGISYDFVD